MSSPIMPIGSPADPPSSSAPPIDGGDIASFVSEISGETGQPPISASQGHPPREVLDQLEEAASAHERLRGEGRELRFTAPEGASLMVELVDDEGATLRELSLAEAFAIAAGETPA